jgi:hypothetical protein
LQPEGSALGWVVSRREGETTSGHGGSAETFQAIVMISHEDGLEVAVLLNSPDSVTSTVLFRAILSRFRAASLPRPGGSPPG